MTAQILVGLYGPAGSGKDSVADILEKDFNFSRYALALPIKRALNSMFHWEMAQWDNREWKEGTIDWLDKSPRVLAQTLGTGWGRHHVHPDLWLRLGLRKWDEVRMSVNPRMVITDVRFDNEAQAILDMGGTVWRVERSEVGPVATHVSESGISQALIVGKVKNHGSLDDLKVTVHEWMQMLRKRYST